MGPHYSLASLLLAAVSGPHERQQSLWGRAISKRNIGSGGIPRHYRSNPAYMRGKSKQYQGVANSLAWEQWEFKDGVARNWQEELSVERSEDAPYLAEENYQAASEALSPFVGDDRLKRMLHVLSQRTSKVRFGIEDPSNPSNAWACLRSLDSFGIQYVDVIQNPGRYPDSPYERTKNKQMKAAMGSQKWLDLSSYNSSADYVRELKEGGWCVVATDLSPKSVSIDELDLSSLGPVAIVLGNERTGISNDMRELVDHCIHLPMHGFAESFSLSVGCAVLLSHMNSCRALKHGTLPQPEKDRLLYEWLAKSVKSSRPILRRQGFNISKTLPKRQRFFGEFYVK